MDHTCEKIHLRNLSQIKNSRSTWGPENAYRFALDGEAADRDTAAFFPVEIEGTLSCANEPLAVSAMSAPVSAQRIDITLSDGRRILVEGPTALASVLALVEGLML